MSSRFRPSPPAPWPAICALGMMMVLLVGGCESPGQRRDGRDLPGPRLPPVAPTPDLAELPPPRPRSVALVLSADTTHYAAVADALDERLPGAAARYRLQGKDPATVLQAIQRAGHTEAVAIGRQALALLAASELRVAYCQIFQPPGPAAGSAAGPAPSGVAALPGYAAQFDAWAAHRPGLARVGLITGAGRDEAAAEIEAAAGSRGLELRRAVVRSDKELLYVFRRMVPEIQGFLLYPDPRVLSPATLREVIAYAAKHDVEVLTYNRAIFDIGAGLLITADSAEVADKVLAVLDSPTASGTELPLSRVVIETHHGEPEAAQ